MRSLLKRPNEILIKQNELQRIALRDEVILNKIENELILLKLEQSKEQQPWKIISEPTIEKHRVSPKRTQKTILSFIFSFFVTAIILIFKEKKTNIVFEENELMQKIKTDMEKLGKVELQPKFDGKQMIMIIQPI